MTGATVNGHVKGRVPRAVRIAQLLDVAEELFLSSGYEGATIDELCRRAEISRPIVYRLIGNKPAIYLACVRRARAELEAALSAAAAGTADPAEQLAHGSRVYFELLERDPRRWQLYFGGTGLVGELADELDRERQRTVDVIAAAVRRFGPAAPADMVAGVASLISGASEQLGRWWISHPDVPLERIVAINAAFVWNGVQALQAPGSTRP